MSNTVVGSAYAQIIERVVQASQIDFEEGGIERQTLNELRDNWQKRLSSLRIAQFPWDPAPAPTNPQSYPNVKSAAANDALEPSAASAESSGSYNGVRIKTEENEGNATGLMNGFPTSNMNTQVAQQRAVSFMEQNFGSQATASIGALQQQTGLSLPGQSRPNGLQLPGQLQQPQQQQQQQQSPTQQQATQPQQPQQPQQPLSATKSQFSPTAARPEQTDGSGDIPDEWMNIRTSASMHGNEERLAADETLRQMVERMSDRMDNGLMVPLDEHCRNRSKKNKGKQRAHANPTDISGLQPSTSSSSTITPLPDQDAQIPQYDGILEDERRIKTEEDAEEVDEDAINSDLDDPDDDLDKEQDEGDDLGETMLCLYDKVQRVKNKWKCTLKDGILTTNQKEYLFQRAQGEFEW